MDNSAKTNLKTDTVTVSNDFLNADKSSAFLRSSYNTAFSYCDEYSIKKFYTDYCVSGLTAKGYSKAESSYKISQKCISIKRATTLSVAVSNL